MNIDPLRFAIAMGPLALYLLVLGVINWSRHPLVVRGGRDSAGLMFAVMGLMLVGPIELFMPVRAALCYRSLTWLLLLLLYLLFIALVMLSMRARIVIYNVDASAMHDLMLRIVPQLDADATWAGDSFVLPNLDIQLHINYNSSMNNASIVALGHKQSLAGWRVLEQAVENAIADIVAPRQARHGLMMIAISAVIIASVVTTFLMNPDSVEQSLAQLFYP